MTTETTDRTQAGRTTADRIQEEVRQRYAAAARAVTIGGGGCCGGPTSDGGGGGAIGDGCGCGPTAGEAAASRSLTADAYPEAERATLPQAARELNLGCGNPLVVAELHEGETVLDLGSGGGGDVLLSARRVGPAGRVYGLDMTDEMLELARRNAAEAGAANVEFRKGHIEQIPLSDASVDVVISNCVINLSTDKAAVFAEMFRVLGPGGRVGVADIVAGDALTPAERAERGDWAGCVAGALSRSEYVAGLTAAGFTDVDVTYTHEAADGIYSAIIKATRP